VTPAEESVLSGLLESSGRTVNDLDLNPEDFSSPVGEAIFRSIRTLVEQGKPADAVAVASGPAMADPVIKAAGGPARVWQITNAYVAEASIPFHAEIVANDAARRRIEMAATLMRQGVAEGVDVDQLVSDVQARLETIGTAGAATTERIGDGIDETIASLDKKPTYVETPWNDLNWLMHGWKKGGMYVVGARPSVGKTVFGFQAAISLCNMGPVAYTSLEMGKEELQKRAISHIARVDMSRIARHQINNQDREAIASARHLFDHMPLHIDPSSDASVAQVAKHARTIKRQYGLAAVVVDYLGLLTGRAGQSEYETVTDASRRLKLLAQELEVPVIALSQLNRGIESRDNKEPRLSDLRSSGAIEQDADVVILMHRDLSETPHELRLIVAKNRQGTLGSVDLDFAGHHSEIRNRTAPAHDYYAA